MNNNSGLVFVIAFCNCIYGDWQLDGYGADILGKLYADGERIASCKIRRIE